MAQKNPGYKIPKMPIIAIIILSLGIIISLYIAGTKKLSETESVLLAFLLSSSSILVSWLITHIYSEINLEEAIDNATEINKENIKNYAVKAAEKVFNLSNQIKRLSELLNGAIEDSDIANSPKESVLLLQERISSAIHNLETLRSMNDTFLSDWRGVIGEEIDKQQLIEKQIEKLGEELDAQKQERDLLKHQLVSLEDLSHIENLLSETEERLTQKFSDLPFKVITRSVKSKKADISIVCPSCFFDIETKFWKRKGARKLISCQKCGQYILVLGINEEEVQVQSIGSCVYNGICPLCKSEIEVEMPDSPGATKSIKCNNCDTSLFISKSVEGFNMKPTKLYKGEIAQKVIDQVRSLLPYSRPWPTHIHKQIATQLGYSNGLVSSVIALLISQGLYPLSENVENTDPV
jgi:hypothetical protein